MIKTDSMGNPFTTASVKFIGGDKPVEISDTADFKFRISLKDAKWLLRGFKRNLHRIPTWGGKNFDGSFRVNIRDEERERSMIVFAVENGGQTVRINLPSVEGPLDPMIDVHHCQPHHMPMIYEDFIKFLSELEEAVSKLPIPKARKSRAKQAA